LLTGSCECLDGVARKARTFRRRDIQAPVAPEVIEDHGRCLLPRQQQIGSRFLEIGVEENILVRKDDGCLRVRATARRLGGVDPDVENTGAVQGPVHS
jgi:hypothetical protein